MAILTVNTLPEFRSKANLVQSNIRLKLLAQLGRRLTADVGVVAALCDEELLDALLRVKDHLNQALARELKRANRN